LKGQPDEIRDYLESLYNTIVVKDIINRKRITDVMMLKSVYYQVALSVRDEATLARELRPLQMIRDHYPKVILTMDDDPEMHYDGIRRINARDWLLGLTD